MAAIEVNKDFIMDKLKTAIATESIEDQEPGIILGSEAPFKKSSSREYSRQAPTNPGVGVPHIRHPFRNTGISNLLGNGTGLDEKRNSDSITGLG